MVKTKTIYCCDLCKEESEQNNLRELVLPAPAYDEYGCKTNMISLSRIEACEKCRKKIMGAIDNACVEYGDYAFQGLVLRFKEIKNGENKNED